MRIQLSTKSANFTLFGRQISTTTSCWQAQIQIVTYQIFLISFCSGIWHLPKVEIYIMILFNIFKILGWTLVLHKGYDQNLTCGFLG